MPGDSDEDFGALLAQFEKEQARRQLIILDSCHSGDAANSFTTRVVGENKEIVELTGRSTVVIGVAGFVADYFTYNGQLIRHSPLTYSPLQALKSDAPFTACGLAG